MSVLGLRTFVGLAIATSGVLAFALPVGASAEAVPANGSIQVTSVSITSIRSADGNMILTASFTGVLTGTFAGAFSEESREALHPSGEGNVEGNVTCACTVTGVGTGLLMFGFTAFAEPDGTFTGKFEILSATGGLSGLHAQATFSSPNGVSATYSGQIHS
jgi:hypothetical protein